MKVTLQDIEHLASLSALEFSDDEIKNFEQEFNQILEFVEQIQNAKVDSQMIYNPVDVSELRDDVEKESLPQEEILSNAPKSNQGCFAVPLMIE